MRYWEEVEPTVRQAVKSRIAQFQQGGIRGVDLYLSCFGPALEAFAAKHADLAVNLNGELENIKFGAKPDPITLANLWTANNDARGYVIIGDPAVRLPH